MPTFRCDLDIWSVNEVGDIPKEELLKRVSGKDALLICSHNRIDKDVIRALSELYLLLLFLFHR